MKMNKDAYIEIIKEDIVWLRKQPRTCEREHIEIVLNNSIQFNYPEKNEWLMDKSVVEVVQEKKNKWGDGTG